MGNNYNFTKKYKYYSNYRKKHSPQTSFKNKYFNLIKKRSTTGGALPFFHKAPNNPIFPDVPYIPKSTPDFLKSDYKRRQKILDEDLAKIREIQGAYDKQKKDTSDSKPVLTPKLLSSSIYQKRKDLETKRKLHKKTLQKVREESDTLRQTIEELEKDYNSQKKKIESEKTKFGTGNC